ncbi:MAG TPA: hypothetical protein ENI81_08155 [Phycisphaerales bacterium]|nr:hypothetical protein [Phycisphaerales bacterium]
MTIQFNCPSCDNLIAFDDKHVGKRARCQSCGQLFIIPSRNYETPQKIEQKVELEEPLPGFWKAAFVDSWKLFVDPENAAALVFVAALVCFRFFLANAVCCINRVAAVVTWGWLFGFYLNLIYETAFEIDKLPQIEFGTALGFFWNIIRPFFVFFVTLFLLWLPFIATLALLQDKGITIHNMWRLELGPRLLLQLFFVAGLFLFPMAILATAVGRDITLLRPDYLLVPIHKAPVPYLTTFVLLLAVALLEYHTRQFGQADLLHTIGRLGLNLAVQVVAIIAMRTIGLFYRHYNCYIPW